MADQIINTGQDDVDQIEKIAENLDTGWKKFVTSINFHGSDSGDVHYFDQFARLQFADRAVLPEIREISCWADRTGIIAYQVAYDNGSVVLRSADEVIPQSLPQGTMTLPEGEFVTSFFGIKDQKIELMAFTATDG